MGRKYFFITTLGCRLNQAEAEEMAEGLINKGWQQTTKQNKADLVVVNTCVVTGKAEHETRKLIRSLRRRNPEALLVVCGCWVNKIKYQKANIKNWDEKILELLDLVIANEEKGKAIEIIEKVFNSSIPLSFPRKRESIQIVSKYSTANRALVWIQSGCQQFCSYCLVPYVRGQMINRPTKGIVNRVKQLVRQGIKEIILTGVNLSYWQDGRLKLLGLVKKILKETSIERIRFGSVDLACFDKEFIQLFKNPRLCRHVHLPIQSGSNRVLKKMRRPYRVEDIKRIVKELRKIEEMSVTTDVMVGFPGETKKDFEESSENIEKIGFDKLHVFSFSKRPGSLAAEMMGRKDWEGVDKKEKQQRSRQMRQLGRKMRIAFLKAQVGKTLPVLFAESSNGRWRGLSDNYLAVEVSSVKNWQGKIRRVKTVERRGLSLLGKWR